MLDLIHWIISKELTIHDESQLLSLFFVQNKNRIASNLLNFVIDESRKSLFIIKYKEMLLK